MIIRNTDKLATVSTDESNPAWRLRMDKINTVISSLSYIEWGEDASPKEISVDLDQLDDVVIARKDIGTSYHLSVVLDDHDSGVTVVTRGKDLESSTQIHRLLQELLGLNQMVWAHHNLITDENGQRLAKRDSSKSIQLLRKQGYAREDILKMIKA